jgi:cysteine-rich repeat protein
MSRSLALLLLASCALESDPVVDFDDTAPMSELVAQQSPPPGNLALQVDPLVPGTEVFMVVDDASPGDRVWFTRATQPGAFCPPVFSGNCLDSANPELIDGVFADANGIAVLRVNLPIQIPTGLEVRLQALVVGGGATETSNVVTRTITTVCGDGIRQLGEACDDGNLDDDDGCSSACEVERCGDGILQPGIGEACDDGGTSPNDGCGPTCQIEFCGDGVRQNTEECDDGNFADNDGCTGACVLEFCGDDIIQTSETCDDGNSEGEDGCSETCQIERCGDGIVQLIEECDDGNDQSNDGCSATCLDEFCGDGVRQTNEACDDGNTQFNDGCNGLCEIEGCGDGVLQPGEDCDDGNVFNNDGCSSTCRVEGCGDGVVQFGEECDDGNTFDNDGCSSTCTYDCCSNTLRIRVNSATISGSGWDNFVGVDPDPYVQVYTGGVLRFQTPTDFNDFTPTWTTSGIVTITPSQSLEFRVFDDDDFSGDDFIGSASVNYTTLQNQVGAGIQTVSGGSVSALRYTVELP